MTEESDDLIIIEDGDAGPQKEAPKGKENAVKDEDSKEEENIVNEETEKENENAVNESNEETLVETSATAECVQDAVVANNADEKKDKAADGILKVDPNIEAMTPWQPLDESDAPVDEDDVVVLDECGEGDELVDTAAKASESEEPPQPVVQASAPKKKERVYKRKIVRIPREVFDYMARIEEDGVVRLNVTQFSVFFQNELTKKFAQVEADSWDKTDLVPLMDISVPPTAKENPSLIVDNFSNEPGEREAQEERLKTIIENRKKFLERQKHQGQQQKEEPASESATGAKILSAQGAEEKLKNKKKKEKPKDLKENGKTTTDGIEEQKKTEEKTLTILELRKKRLAERSSPSTQSGSAAKQPRLDVKSSTQSKTGKTFPKKNGPVVAKGTTGTQNGSKGLGKWTSPKASSKGAPSRKTKTRNVPARYRRSRKPPFSSPPMGRNMAGEWQNGPTPFSNDGMSRNQRFEGVMYDEQTRYGEPYSFGDRRGGGDVSPWVRPPTQELQKLESVMRRAAQENASSMEAIRQVEKMGLGSVMGVMLNAVDHRNTGYSAFETSSSRAIPSLIEESLVRDPRMSGGFDRNAASIRDIGRFVEPFEDFSDRSHMRTSQQQVQRITYPLMGGAVATDVGGGGGAPPFGQSYSAFPNQSYGAMMDYRGSGRHRSRSPIGRSYR